MSSRVVTLCKYMRTVTVTSLCTLCPESFHLIDSFASVVKRNGARTMRIVDLGKIVSGSVLTVSKMCSYKPTMPILARLIE